MYLTMIIKSTASHPCTENHPDMDFEIYDLRDRPEFAEQVICQVYQEFRFVFTRSIEEFRLHFTTEVPRDNLPVTLIGIRRNRLGGALSLRELTLGALEFPDSYLLGVSPWLSNTWVAKWARGAGLATRLSYALEDVARDLGYGVIYSSCQTEDSLYHKMGYRTIERRSHLHHTVFQIKKELPTC